MDTKTEGLVTLIDHALELAKERLSGIKAGHNDASTIEGMEVIIAALLHRREEATSTGYEIVETDVSLGLVRAALEYDLPKSELINSIGDIERYFTRYFVRQP